MLLILYHVIYIVYGLSAERPPLQVLVEVPQVQIVDIIKQARYKTVTLHNDTI